MAEAIGASLDPRELSYGRDCGADLEALTFAAQASDADGDSLSYRIVDAPSQGEASVSGTGLVFRPARGQAGQATFTYVANDGSIDSDPATVTVEIRSQEMASFQDYGLVLEGQAGHFTETYGLGAPTVAWVPAQNQWVMYFESRMESPAQTKCSQSYQVGRATSPDGLVWTLDENPIIAPASGTFYSCNVAQPAIVFDGSVFHLWFNARKLDSSGKKWVAGGIGYATSADGVAFSTPANLLEAEAGTSTETSFPSALLAQDGSMELYYWGKDSGAQAVKRARGSASGSWDSTGTSVLLAEKSAATKSWSAGTAWENVDNLDSSPGAICGRDGAQIFLNGRDSTGSTTSETAPYRIFGLFDWVASAFSISAELPSVANPATFFRHAEPLRFGNNFLLYYVDLSGNVARVRLATTFESYAGE